MSKRKKQSKPVPARTGSGATKAAPRSTPRRGKASRPSTVPLLIGGGTLLALLAIWGIIFLSTRSTEPKPNALSTPTVSASMEATPVVRGPTGKTKQEDQEQALAAATNLLNLAGKSPTKANNSQRMMALDKDDLSVIDPALPQKIRWTSDSGAGMKATTYQSLISLHALLSENKPNTVIAPIDPRDSKNVYVDQQAGVAYVPLEVYSRKGALLSFEMMYLDGEWKLAPYSLVEAVRLSAILSVEAQSNAPSATASPKK